MNAHDHPRGSKRRMRGSLGIPALEWLQDYQGAWLKGDLVAGMTSAAVVIPKALAYATIAGLPVQVGLYTVLVPAAIYAVLGSSRPLSFSTTTTLAILAGAAIGNSAGGDPAALLTASATLAFLVGAFLVLAGLLRLGFVANFISEPVLVGFKAGIGVVIVLDQLPKLLGIHFEKGGFLHNLLATLRGIPESSLPTLAVGVVMILTLVGLKRYAKRVPAPLVAVALGIAGMALLHLDQFGVSMVGKVPTGLPALTLPDWTLLNQLWPAAIGIALMSFTETIAAGRAFAGPDDPTPPPNRELLASGVANIGGAFLGGMVAGGGTTQTAVNRSAGAHSQLAGLITAALALGTCLLLAPFIGLMPNATLAAVVIVYSVGLIEPAEFNKILEVRRTEFVWALAAMAGVMLLGTLKGILVAIVVSLFALAHQVSDPPLYVLARKRGSNLFRPRTEANADDESFPGLLMLRPEGRIFFGNAERLGLKMKPLILDARPKVAIIDLSRVFDLEYTALKMLMNAEKHLREKHVELWLSGMNPGVQEMVMRSPLRETLGGQRVFANVEEALTHYLSQRH